MAKSKVYFPIVIKICITDEILIINKPEELPQGISFIIVKTSEKDK